MGISPIVICLSICWVYLDGLIKIIEGLSILAFFKIGISTIIIGQSIPWIFLDGFGEIRNSIVKISFMNIGCSSVIIDVLRFFVIWINA